MCIRDRVNAGSYEDGIRDAQESRGLGDVYKRQIRNNKEYYRDNNKERNADCAADADGASTSGVAASLGEDLPCDVADDESLVLMLALSAGWGGLALPQDW